MKYTALYCREDSAYKKRPDWDVYDKIRDARTYCGTNPVVCHPPCRAWSACQGLSFNTSSNPGYEQTNEMQLALAAATIVFSVGGILEHPLRSKLWKCLPLYHGLFIKINQHDFGHVANKATGLFIYPKVKIPELPLPGPGPTHKMFVRKAGDLHECTQYQREYTPDRLIDFFEKILDAISTTSGISTTN